MFYTFTLETADFGFIFFIGILQRIGVDLRFGALYDVSIYIIGPFIVCISQTLEVELTLKSTSMVEINTLYVSH